MNKFKAYKNLLTFLLCLVPLIASAQTTTSANLEVTATVQAACKISTEPLKFGNYDPLSTDDLNAQGAIVMNCVARAAPKIYLDLGKNPKTGIRQMAGPSNGFLEYKLFQPDNTTTGQGCASKNTEWKDSGNNRLITTASTSINTIKYAVCGVIPKNQFTSEGEFTDTVIARFDFSL